MFWAWAPQLKIHSFGGAILLSSLAIHSQTSSCPTFTQLDAPASPLSNGGGHNRPRHVSWTGVSFQNYIFFLLVFNDVIPISCIGAVFQMWSCFRCSTTISLVFMAISHKTSFSLRYRLEWLTGMVKMVKMWPVVIPGDIKILQIFFPLKLMDKNLDTVKALQDLNMSPKEFMVHFLRSNNSDLAFRRRFWATKTGYKSSLTVVECVRDKFESSLEGQGWWAQFIQDEVSQRFLLSKFYHILKRLHTWKAVRILVMNNQRLAHSSSSHFQSS